MSSSPKRGSTAGLTRRQFIHTSALGAAGLLTTRAWGQSTPAASPAVAGKTGSRPNIVFISADELGINAISGHGCPDVHTPNIDRLVRRGLSFQQCYTANPLCSPARSTWFTGRMASETGVVTNNIPIHQGMPTMGNILRAAGYNTYYAGKWHLPMSYTDQISGFNVLPGGIGSEGQMGDTAVSQACQGLLRNVRDNQPFLLVASLLQPHDICSWTKDRLTGTAAQRPKGLEESQLPALPPNFNFDQRQPKLLKKNPITWSEPEWRYYLWCYYRHVEEVDAEIGRILDAIEDSPHAANTLIMFCSDHGEGQARHRRIQKNNLYEEGVKVPLIFSWPGHVPEGVRNENHFVSSTDYLSTFCDYAGIPAPQRVVGRSLRPLLEGNNTQWRDMVAAEVVTIGRMIRTDQYKFVTYRDDPTIQLFDMKSDPWETKNLAFDAPFASVVEDHRKLLTQWESRLDPVAQPRKIKKKKRAKSEDSE